ncbi:uncharacterized protein [Aristolochia californica]|uniref:uncharacterized protein n=1 Tax=Aristolochia californica TaxID=171875 RepID=UPI0035E10D32
MATGWVKSLQCKSRAFEDVFQPNPKALNLLPNSGCTRSAKSLKDVVQNKPKKRHHPPPSASQSHRQKSLSSPNRSLKSRLHTKPSTRSSNSYFPSLTELPDGHSSRNVVEIIFQTSWSEKAFPGRIEMLFKVQNLSGTVARFEEYREMVKARASAGGPGSRKESSRCVADGNEVMRFHCVGPALGSVCDASGLCTFSGKGTAIRTFAGSGGAHESVGGGRGRRAMLVCRVIAGRVCKGVESFLEGATACGFDSVSGEDESLIVFDSRALLPCFLIIYKV